LTTTDDPMLDPSSRSRWGAVVVGTLVLLVGSLLPSPFDRHPEWRWAGPDKLLHLVGHAGYTVALADAFGAGRFGEREAAALAVGVSTTHSLLTGRLQKRVPGRRFELADVLAAVVGSVLAALGWCLVRGRRAGEGRRPTHRPADGRRSTK
jgi:VanZ family protein